MAQQGAGASGPAALQAQADASAAPAPNRTGMPDGLKAAVEHLSGRAMDDVRVHHGSGAAAQLQAHAFARGGDIHIGPGQGRHLAHEVWHVVRQKQGRVRPERVLPGGVAVNDSPALEAEADHMGAAAERLSRTPGRCNAAH